MGLSLAGVDVLMPPVPTTGTDGEDRPPPTIVLSCAASGGGGTLGSEKGKTEGR